MTFLWGMCVFLCGKPLRSTSFSKISGKLMEDVAKPLLQCHLAPWAVQSATGVIKTWQPRWKWRVWRDCGGGFSSYIADVILQTLSNLNIYIYGTHTKKRGHKVDWWMDKWIHMDWLMNGFMCLGSDSFYSTNHPWKKKTYVTQVEMVERYVANGSVPLHD